jgi:hypothetical protein
MSVFKYHAFIFLDQPPPWRSETCIIVHCALLTAPTTVTKIIFSLYYLFQENKSFGSKKPFAFILWCMRSCVEQSPSMPCQKNAISKSRSGSEYVINYYLHRIIFHYLADKFSVTVPSIRFSEDKEPRPPATTYCVTVVEPIPGCHLSRPITWVCQCLLPVRIWCHKPGFFVVAVFRIRKEFSRIRILGSVSGLYGSRSRSYTSPSDC